MNRLFPLISGFLILLLSASTCEEDLDFNQPDPAPKLVVISNFTNDRALQVQVTRSRSVLDNSPEEYISNARVWLMEGDLTLEELKLVIPQNTKEGPYFTTVSSRPEVGVDYTIRVEAPGFETVEAQSSIPPKINLTAFRIDKIEMEQVPESSLERYYFTVSVSFHDNPDERNYYHLILYQKINDYIELDGDTVIVDSRLYPVYFSKSINSNYITAHLSGGLLLEDDPLNGNYTFRFSADIDPEMQLISKLFVDLRTVSDDYYFYYRSLSRIKDADNGGFFGDPVILYNNILNGHGNFAGFSQSQDSLLVVN
ncbi:MAG TPA: DUF4249 domain-containing protein [Flavilitoribacter sp.]|nr:DUF4249 domain-containing protein [Flavilitoribacter sp.]HMQ88391.1 DUF4249 domain-containing protein [Flavilitoribacter sp.]